MSEALQHHTQTTALAPPPINPLEGLEGFDDTPLKPAEFELVQFMSKTEGAIPGTLRNRRTGEHFKELRVVPVKYWQGRVLFPPGNDFTAKPMCKSFNGVEPIQGENLVPQSPKCITCDFGPRSWKNNKTPPRCKETYRWLMIDVESGLPFFLTVKGTSIKATKQVINALKEYCIKARIKGDNRNLYDFVLTLKPLYETSKNGKWYSVTYTDIAKIAEVGKYAELYRQLTTRPLEDVEGESEGQVEEVIESALEEV